MYLREAPVPYLHKMSVGMLIGGQCSLSDQFCVKELRDQDIGTAWHVTIWETQGNGARNKRSMRKNIYSKYVKGKKLTDHYTESTYIQVTRSVMKLSNGSPKTRFDIHIHIKILAIGKPWLRECKYLLYHSFNFSVCLLILQRTHRTDKKTINTQKENQAKTQIGNSKQKTNQSNIWKMFHSS